MEVIIHGAIGGAARLIYPAQNVSAIASTIVIDLRRGNNEYPLKQSAYSIEIVLNGCVFSKCLIVRDVQRKAMGYVAFSVFIPNHEKLPGADITGLLDRLDQDYRFRNIDEHNFDIRKNDCDFINALSSEYKGRLRHVSEDDADTNPPGAGEAAYIYYDTDEELQKYFDAPYQEDYNHFKQVFFVKGGLEGKPENPLNALRHNPVSNLTRQIDLENTKYKLQYREFTNSGVDIEVWANGTKRSNGSKINKKNELEIIYSKPYYQQKRKTGRLYEIGSEFVIVDEKAQKVTIREVELTPETKYLSFEVKDDKSNPVYDADITVRAEGHPPRKVSNNKMTFSAEELNEKWTVSGKKGNYSATSQFVPGAPIGTVVLNLMEHKILTITALDEDNGDLIHGITIEVSSKKQANGNEIEFVGDEIERKWKITISDIDKKYNSDSYLLVPGSEDNSITIRLRKRQLSGGKDGEHSPIKIDTPLTSHGKKKHFIGIPNMYRLF